MNNRAAVWGQTALRQIRTLPAFAKYCLCARNPAHSAPMISALEKMRSSPLLVRVVPFLLFVVLTVFQGRFGETSQYWVYLAKIIVGAWLLWLIRSQVPEMRWSFSWEAVVVGIAVFGMWVGLDPFYRKFGQTGPGWNPFASFPTNEALAWVMVAGRILGSTLVVPPLEEVFYRSFVYRYIIRQDFQGVPLNEFRLVPFLVSALIFGLAHFEWLAGILCALAYHWLILHKNRLGDAILAHAITNFLLGLWVVWKRDWHFW